MQSGFDRGIFQQAYQMAMAQKAPRMYRGLMREKALKSHLKEATDEAESLYRATFKRLTEELGIAPDQASNTAQELAFAQMIEFPQE